MSEVMLARSISSSSLLREAATTALYSQRRGPRRSDASSEFSESKLPSEVPSRDQPDYFTSRSSSCCDTPSEKKHIRFDDRVEQCIAVDHKDLGLDEDSDDEDRARDYHPDGSSTSSDEDGGLVMKRSSSFLNPNSANSEGRPKTGSRRNSYTGRKIIETLPATTLKYRTDSPDITEQAQHHTFGRAWNSGANSNQSRLSPRASQETLRPSNPSANFLLPEDDDDEDGDVDDDDDAAADSDSSWSFGASNPKSSLGASVGARGRNYGKSRRGGDYDEYDEDQMAGMRRTGSGMFMPYDDDEFGSGSGSGATGIFGRVSETINTARDIAHVIWTVGWRT